MGKPYSEDLRRGIVQGIEAGHSYEEVAELYGVSVSSVSRFVTRWRTTGSVAAAKFGGYKGYALERYRDRITRWVAAQPDITLAELQLKFPRFRGHPSICVAGVHDGKKERTLHAGVSASDD